MDFRVNLGNVGGVVEELERGEDLDLFFGEEEVDVVDVPLEEGEGHGVVVLYALADVDNPDDVLVVEQVVLTQVCMDQLALLVQLSQDLHHLQVHFPPLVHSQLHILQSRSTVHILPDELHH